MGSKDSERLVGEIIESSVKKEKEMEGLQSSHDLITKELCSLKRMEKEMEDLQSSHDLITKELCILKRMEGVDEPKRLNYEEKLFRLERKCDEVGESVLRLREDHRLSNERAERVACRYSKHSENYSQMGREKNKKICELKERFNEMARENEKLKREKLAADQIIDEMKLEKERFNEMTSNLKREKLVADRIIDEMKLKQLESEVLRNSEVGASKKDVEDLVSRIVRVEAGFATIFNIEVDDLIKIVEKSVLMDMNKKMAFPVSGVEKESQGCGNTHKPNNMDAGDCPLMPPGSRDVTTEPSKRKIQEGGINNTGKSSPQADAECRCLPPQSNSNDANAVKGSKRLRSSDPIEIESESETSDSDDERNPGGAGSRDVIDQSSKRKIKEDGINNTGNSSPQADAECRCLPPQSNSNDAFAVKGSKRLRSSDPIEIESETSDSDDRNPGGSGFVALEDSDDNSCPDSYMNAIIENLKIQKLRRTWISNFQKEDSLCMMAVCVLYRQFILSSKSLECIYHFQAMSGDAVAKYLIDGDLDLRLKKSISEVKQERPDIINLCRRIAIAYSEKLLSIYCTGQDPFFN